MDIQKLKEELMFFEGVSSVVYVDSLGYKTAGIGHLLSGNEKNLAVGALVSDRQVNAWFIADIKAASIIARSLFTNFDQLSDTRQRLLVNLAFNLGYKLSSFKKFINHINCNNFIGASNELKNSLWFKQVGRRGPLMANAFVTDKLELK